MKTFRCTLSELPSEIIDRLNAASFFSSVGFAKLWNTLGGREVYWVTENDSRVLAVLPGVEFGRKPIKRFQAMPFGCYSRLFFAHSDREDKKEITDRVMSELSGAGYIKLALYDFHSCFDPHPDYRTRICYTTLVDISSPNWEPPDKKLRQQIRKARRQGIRIEAFDAARHFQGFLELVRLSERRIGRRLGFGASFFNALAALAVEDKRLRWVWCEHDGEPVSSNIFLVEGDNLLHWQAYFNEAFSFLQPSKYIPFAMARSAAEEGITRLNLGSTPRGAPGVELYKGKWGGERYRYNCYFRGWFL